ncbi:MAG: OB-fold domain-containing protein [Thermoplasmata archaeon]|nr:OB-fold domain-containing protein [Thermoplasmata archaeon]MCI4361729.1 OB-fold domain-containing protein [Thermoplasmata archaeon]
MSETSLPLHSIAAYRRGYEEEHRLLGFRSACGFVTATWSLACPRCGARDLTEAELASTGRLVAFSVQTVPSDEFLNDAPYAYVLVDLDGGGRVTGWIPGIGAESELSVGGRVRFSPSYKPGVQFARISDGGSTP